MPQYITMLFVFVWSAIVTVVIVNATSAIGYWDVKSISNVLMAHIHMGGKASNGYETKYTEQNKHVCHRKYFNIAETHSLQVIESFHHVNVSSHYYINVLYVYIYANISLWKVNNLSYLQGNNNSLFHPCMLSPIATWAFNASTPFSISGKFTSSWAFNPSVNNVTGLLASGNAYFNVHTSQVRPMIDLFNMHTNDGLLQALR